MRFAAFLLVLFCVCPAWAGARLDALRARGYLNCWVSDNFPGFAERDADGGDGGNGSAGTWQGFEVDLCRAVAAAALGRIDAVRLIPATSVHDFLAQDEADIVFRRLTWTARREAPGQLVFGPVVFNDAQGLLLDRRQLGDGHDLSGRTICVSTNPAHQRALRQLTQALKPAPVTRVLDDSVAAHSWREAGCAAWSSDLTTLELARQRDRNPAGVALDQRLLGLEPLAPLIKSDDPEFVRLASWMLHGLVAAARGDFIELDDELAQQLGLAPGAWESVLAQLGTLAQMEQRHFGAHGRLPLPWLMAPDWRTPRLDPPAGPALR